jgi:hypothetical protein
MRVHKLAQDGKSMANWVNEVNGELELSGAELFHERMSDSFATARAATHMEDVSARAA